MHILLAEDDHNISTIISITLEQLGDHQVTLVENGQEAVDKLKIEKYDLILLDGMMPIKDGLEACREIKNIMKIETPVIFLSAKTDEDSKAEYLSLGAIGLINKPFDPSTICEQIENVLAQHGTIAC